METVVRMALMALPSTSLQEGKQSCPLLSPETPLRIRFMQRRRTSDLHTFPDYWFPEGDVTMSEYRLTQEIIARSSSKIWDHAKLEWKLDHVYEADEPETCLCGHFPIIELCNIRNTVNGAHATVGNCCVKKFIGLPSDLIFQAVKRVRSDNTKSLNAAAIEYAFGKGWINRWEQDFYLKIMRKRVLTTKQRIKKVEINDKFVVNMQRSPRQI